MNNGNNNIRIRDKGKLFYLSSSITKKTLLLEALLLNRDLSCLFLFSTEWRFFFENFLAFFPSFPNQWKYQTLLCTNTQIHIYTMITLYMCNNGFEKHLWVYDWALWICKGWRWSCCFTFSHTLLRKWPNPNWQWGFGNLDWKFNVLKPLVFLRAHREIESV